MLHVVRDTRHSIRKQVGVFESAQHRLPRSWPNAPRGNGWTSQGTIRGFSCAARASQAAPVLLFTNANKTHATERMDAITKVLIRPDMSGEALADTQRKMSAKMDCERLNGDLQRGSGISRVS